VHLIIADAEIELIPDELLKFPAVRATARRRGKKPSECLLDSSLHYSALRHLKDGGRRGRADITHFCLLLALDSIANRKGMLHTFVHTRNDLVMEFSPDVRLPKNYNRFAGLMEDVLVNGGVWSEGRQLISLKKESLKSLLERLGGRAYLLEEDGKQFSSFASLRDATVIIGGFPHGSFISDVGNMCRRISISGEKLMAWSAVSIVLARAFPAKLYF
jgi:rRNA small subunit pseudouridine methyltransferase Nep1